MINETRDPGAETNAAGEITERREALLKIGKYAAYAAPFTVLALTNKAEAATGHGPGKGGASGIGPAKH
jgi:hypothetical protein